MLPKNPKCTYFNNEVKNNNIPSILGSQLSHL